MQRIYFLLFLSTIFIYSQSSAQQQKRCGTSEYVKKMIEADPLLALRIEKAKADIQLSVERRKLARQIDYIITIPVVVHVIHNGENPGTGANITEAQILSQIDVLNEDFRRLNADTTDTPSQWKAIGADTHIEFCMASTDPTGNPTNGITRIVSAFNNQTYFDTNVKPNTTWDATKYLNIWTTDLTSMSVLGYATPPGTAGSNRDGVVVSYQFFGRTPANPFNNDFNLGRTATHEVGHWLGLSHPWGDGDCTVDDGLDDTPLSGAPNYGCLTGHVSCGTVDMIENYMDYSDDDCINLFTLQQAELMQSTLYTPARIGILTSLACRTKISLSGEVRDAVTGNGVPNAELYFSDGGLFFELDANGNGQFSTNTFAEGDFNIYAGKWGYITKLETKTITSANNTNLIIEINPGYYDDFLFDLGWTTGGTADEGLWERAVPLKTTIAGSLSCNPGEDVSKDFEIQCFVTGNGGPPNNNDDVERGTVILTSPVFDLSSYSQPKLTYNRWFCNANGNNTPNDELTITIDNGSITVEIEKVDVNSLDLNQWVEKEIFIKNVINVTSTMQLIVSTGDLQASPHIVEAGFDMFRVVDHNKCDITIATSTTATQTGVNEGSATAIASGGNPPYTYLWNDQSAQSTETATGLGLGTFNVTVTDIMGCQKITSATIGLNTGISSNAINNSIQVSPNPFDSKVIVSHNLPSSQTEVIVYNNLGKEVKRLKADSKNIEIDLKMEADGIYFLLIDTGEGIYNQKLIKVSGK